MGPENRFRAGGGSGMTLAVDRDYIICNIKRKIKARGSYEIVYQDLSRAVRLINSSIAYDYLRYVEQLHKEGVF